MTSRLYTLGRRQAPPRLPVPASPRMRLAARMFFLAVALGLGRSPLAAQESEFTVPDLKPAQQWTYRWQTSGLLSVLFPSAGDGRLTIEAPVNGTVRAELRLDADGKIFWLTGSVIDVESLSAREIWSTYRWRGRTRTRHREVEEDGVVDMLAAILTLRRDLPQEDLPMRFQAGSTVYPIVAQSRPESLNYRLEDRADTGQKRWNKSAEIRLAAEPPHPPEHIRLNESLVRIDLELVDGG